MDEQPSPVVPRPRNVLLVVADQWRGDALGCLKHPCLRTPHLDRLASEGTLFRRHYSQAAPCGPGRASLYTGMYMFNHRCVDNGTPLDARFTNFAIEARRAGHDPTLFGYTSTSVDPRTVDPSDPRLTDYEGVLPGLADGVAGKWQPWLDWLAARGFKGPLTPELASMRKGTDQGWARFTAPALYSAEESETAFLCDELLQWLRPRQGRGWFAHLSIKKPHPPWVAPEPFNRMYDPADMPAPRRGASAQEDSRQHPFLAWMIANHRRPHYTLAGERLESSLDTQEVRAARAAYFGLMSEVDHHIGRIVEYLRASAELDETLVIFTSDHGEQLGDHHIFGKSGYFDAAFHVPLVVRFPGSKAASGRVVDEFTEAVDIMPTILDALGLEVPPQCDGEPLTPFLRGETPDGWRRHARWEFDFRNIRSRSAARDLGLQPDQCSLAVIRGERYKYVHFAALPALLFDMAQDPGEFQDVSTHPSCQSQRLALAGDMISWRMTHADRVLANMQVGEGGLFEWRGPRRASQGQDR